MTKRTLTAKYFAEMEIDVEFPDEFFTKAEIEGAARVLADSSCPDGCVVINYKWDVTPIPAKQWNVNHE